MNLVDTCYSFGANMEDYWIYLLGMNVLDFAKELSLKLDLGVMNARLKLIENDDYVLPLDSPYCEPSSNMHPIFY